jgi:hypothetical protein
MAKFSFECTNRIDRNLRMADGRVRPACLDAAFEANPSLAAISVDLILVGAHHDTLLPKLPIRAWQRTETGDIHFMQVSEMDDTLLTAIASLAGREAFSHAPLRQHIQNFINHEDTKYYTNFFMRHTTIIGWTHTQDGMIPIEGKDIECALPNPADILGCVYAEKPRSNHATLRHHDLVKQDILDHHCLTEFATGVTFSLRHILTD